MTVFADTTVVACALDDSEPGKRQVARTLLQHGIDFDGVVVEHPFAVLG